MAKDREPYDHHGLTVTQRACRTAITMGKSERDMTNHVAAGRVGRQLLWLINKSKTEQ